MQNNKYTKLIIILFAGLLVLTPFFSGGRNVYIQELIIIISSIALLLSLFTQKKEFKLYLPDVFLVGFLFFSLLSSIFSTSPYKSFASFSLLISYSFIYIVFSRLELDKKYKNFLLNLIIGITSVLCFFGIWFYIFGNYVRLTSFFYWPNPFASYLLLILPISIYFLIKNKNNIKYKLYLLSTVLFISSLILTGSRGAFIALALGIIFAFIITKTRIKKSIIKSTLIIIILSIILTIGLNILKTNNFQIFYWNKEKISFSDGSTNIRLGYWQGAWDIFKDNKWAGSGLDTFGTIYPAYQKNPVNAGRFAHNYYLEILSEGGILVFLLFIGFIYSIFSIGLKAKKKNNMLAYLLISTFMFLLHIGVDIGWSYSANLILLWMILGLIVSGSYNKKQIYILNIKYLKFILIVISILLITKETTSFLAYNYYEKGIYYKNSGEYLLAEENFQKSINLSFNNPNYLRELGIIQYTIGLQNTTSLNKAYATASKVIQKDSRNSSNYELRGRINLALTNYTEAKNDFTKTIKLDPNNHPSYYGGLVESYIGLEDYIEAKKIIKKTLDSYPENVIKNREINIMRKQEIKSSFRNEIKYLKKLLETI